jgi:hypothetical protein
MKKTVGKPKPDALSQVIGICEADLADKHDSYAY